MPKENSLFHLLHRNESHHLSSKMKKELAITLAKALKSIHDRSRNNLRDSE